MAITKSAKKAIRQNLRRKERNIVYKDNIKKLVKQTRSLMAQKKAEEAKNLLPKVFKVFDKAAKAGVIKKNRADRSKSRLTKLVSKS